MSQELDCRPAHIRKALDRGEFSLLFQPRFDLYRQSVSALEALVRWKRPGLHTPGPDVFIPLLEESGAIHELGHWVLDRSCARLRDWKDRGVNLRLSVNLSPVQCHPALASGIHNVLVRHGLTPHDLELEVTESLFLSADVMAVVDALATSGFQVAIDDFGTGHSTLFALRKFSAATIKIDKSFFDGVPANLDACLLLRSIIDLGHSLGMKVVCEGVETDEQKELAELFGADEIQGYLIARPLPPSEVVKIFGAGDCAGRAA